MEVLMVSAKFNVSTHSRLKAAGKTDKADSRLIAVSTHSRLKAAGPLTNMAVYM